MVYQKMDRMRALGAVAVVFVLLVSVATAAAHGHGHSEDDHGEEMPEKAEKEVEDKRKRGILHSLPVNLLKTQVFVEGESRGTVGESADMEWKITTEDGQDFAELEVDGVRIKVPAVPRVKEPEHPERPEEPGECREIIEEMEEIEEEVEGENVSDSARNELGELEKRLKKCRAEDEERDKDREEREEIEERKEKCEELQEELQDLREREKDIAENLENASREEFRAEIGKIREKIQDVREKHRKCIRGHEGEVDESEERPGGGPGERRGRGERAEERREGGPNGERRGPPEERGPGFFGRIFRGIFG
ncbi:MAG: hypothetical protein SVV03_06695 [Candidatus Nanohaloarchaea archaeon]|nr:hypothetical protein [Candidatus Nanohaloarchaea archaeon]